MNTPTVEESGEYKCLTCGFKFYLKKLHARQCPNGCGYNVMRFEENEEK